jgi:nucleotide-binding universal stress UspA family protein
MFDHAIVGVDGRASGRDAVALARLLVAPREPLLLAHVYNLRHVDTRSIPFGQAERDAALLLLERERSATGVGAKLMPLAASSVGRGLHYLAEKHHADLLAVGSCERGFVGRVMVGDDTRASLIGAPCAVAIAPLGYADTGASIARIGVGYDGSPESQAALALARELAAHHGAAVHVLEVVEIRSLAYSGFGGMAYGVALENMVTEARKRVDEMEGVAGKVVIGLAGEEVAAFGAGVDLLVVGSRGYGPLRRLILGSTSQYLASHARSPLLVLPRQAVSGQDAQIGAQRDETAARAPA